MCFTDSPYNVDYSNSAKDKLRGKGRPILNDNMGEEFGAFLYDGCVNILTVTKGAGDHGSHYGGAISLAKSLHRASHRFDPPGVPGSRHHL
jgi:hypothetical protein